MPMHLIVHQFDPTENLAGGVHGYIKDMIRLAPPGHDFRVVGVDARGDRKLGAWETVKIGDRTIEFLSVAHLSAGDARFVVPHTARLVGGLLAFRRSEPKGTFVHAHRVETGAALHISHPRNRLIQFVHTDSRELARFRTESFWRFLPRLHDAFERRTVRAAYRSWIMSAAAAARLSTGDRGTVRHGRNWYDESLFHDSAAPREPDSIGWIGRFESSKDPVKAVETLIELRRLGSSFSAWFAGGGTLEGEMRGLVDQHDLQDDVTFLGTLSPAELAGRLQSTRALLVTSRWEGQPRAVLEALACGTAVVSTAVGDVPSIVEHGRTGFIASVGTSSELADLLATISELSEPSEIARSVDAYRASAVIGSLFADLEDRV